MRGKEAHQQRRRGCPVTTMVRCATARCTITTERTGPGGSKLEDRSTPWGARSGPLQHPDIDLKREGGGGHHLRIFSSMVVVVVLHLVDVVLWEWDVVVVLVVVVTFV